MKMMIASIHSFIGPLSSDLMIDRSIEVVMDFVRSFVRSLKRRDDDVDVDRRDANRRGRQTCRHHAINEDVMGV